MSETRTSQGGQNGKLPPGPHGRPIIGMFSEFRRLGPVQFHRQLHEVYGDLVRYPFLGGDRYLNRPF